MSKYKLGDYINVTMKSPKVLPRLVLQKVKKRVYIFNNKIQITGKKQSKSQSSSIKEVEFFIKDKLEGQICYEENNAIISEAEKILSGDLSFIGIGNVNLSEIDWHRDYKTGYIWDRKHYSTINIYHKPIDVDIKTVWELNRMHHLVTLGQAWKLTKDKEYAVQIVNSIKSWSKQNKVGFGVSWLSAMEVSIRAVNIAVAFFLIRDSEYASDSFKDKITRLLLDHGKYIMSNLEWFPQKSGNHYISNLCGLIFIGVLFPQIKESNKWVNFGIKELEYELNSQTLPDGSNFEASTSYHKLVLEMVLYTTLLLLANNYSLPQRFFNNLSRMLSFTSGYLKNNGYAPQIGDNDSGRFLIFYPRNPLDHGYLLEIGSLISTCEQSNYLYPESKWLKCQKKVLDWRPEGANSFSFKNIGLYFMKSRNAYSVISCGILGQNGNGGHSHNDKLSIEINVEGMDFIVDPGTYVYTGNKKWRNFFKSTKSHSTISLDGLEQNIISNENIFTLANETNCKCQKWQVSENMDVFVGSHKGFLLKNGLIHKRKIVFDKGSTTWRVQDLIYRKNMGSYNNKHDMEFRLILHPEVTAELISPKKIKLVNNRVTLLVKFNIDNGQGLSISDHWYSCSYGKKEPTNSITLKSKITVPYKLEWQLEKIND